MRTKRPNYRACTRCNVKGGIGTVRRLDALSCLINRHVPDRSNVHGTNAERTKRVMTSECVHCGAPILRRRSKVWVRSTQSQNEAAPTE